MHLVSRKTDLASSGLACTTADHMDVVWPYSFDATGTRFERSCYTAGR
jgi:hypothetical protein